MKTDKDDEFPEYVHLGWDGLGYIATCNTSREDAARLVRELPYVSNEMWEEFVKKNDE